MEFIIGLQHSPVALTPNSELHELIFITERTNKITIEAQTTKVDGDEVEIVSAIVLNGGDIDLRVRDEEHSLLTRKQTDQNSIHLVNTPFLDEIVLQQTLVPAPDRPNTYSRQITYLKIRRRNKVIEVGTLHSPVVKPEKYVILPKESVLGPCMITGIGMHNADIMCLQLIQTSFSYNQKGQFPEHLYAYGKSKVGLVNLRKDGGFKKVEKTLFVGMENSEPDVMNVVTKLYTFMASWYSSRSSIHRMFPDLYSIIDQSITENDRSVIFSAFRLERHLKYRIRNELTGHGFDADPFVRMKLYQVIKCLTSTLEQCQRIIVNKPSMNCYSAAYLAGDLSHFLIALLVLSTQVGLTYVLFMSIITDLSDSEYFALKESTVVTPIIAVFSAMLVFKQFSNSLATRRAYPGMEKSLLGICEFFANGFLAIAILIIQVIIVAKQDNRVEYVLNSIAAIFILELDDTCVFFDKDGITDLHRRMLISDFCDRVKNIDGTFFEYLNWRSAREYLQLNLANYSIEALPAITFLPPAGINGAEDSNDELDSNLSPLIIKIDSKCFKKVYDGWFRIAESEPIAKSAVLKHDSSCKLRFRWHDQGYGNRKGRLRVRLLNPPLSTGVDFPSSPESYGIASSESSNTFDVACSPEYGIAPHDEEWIEESFEFNHGLVRNCVEGQRYVVEIIVGGGGGHELHLNDFEFSSNTVFVECNDVADENV